VLTLFYSLLSAPLWSPVSPRYQLIKRLFNIPGAFLAELLVQEPALLAMSSALLQAKFDTLVDRCVRCPCLVKAVARGSSAHTSRGTFAIACAQWWTYVRGCIVEAQCRGCHHSWGRSRGYTVRRPLGVAQPQYCFVM
jgi:hypothetical protein